MGLLVPITHGAWDTLQIRAVIDRRKSARHRYMIDPLVDTAAAANGELFPAQFRSGRRPIAVLVCGGGSSARTRAEILAPRPLSLARRYRQRRPGIGHPSVVPLRKS